jgi:hypothetical protein
MTWYVDQTAWRVERIFGRWPLSLRAAATETWQRAGSYPNRKAAISAAYEDEKQRWSRHRYTEAPRTGHPGGAPEAQDRRRGPDRGGSGRQTLPAVQRDSSCLHHCPHIRQRRQ